MDSDCLLISNEKVLTNGKVTHKVTHNMGEELKIHLKSGYTNCTTTTIYYWYQDCTTSFSYSVVGENTYYNSDTECGNPYEVYGGTSVECFYVEDENSGGNGGSRSSGGNSGDGSCEPGGYCYPDPPAPDPNKPCIGDPIKYPMVSPTNSGRVIGGTYGCVRIVNDEPNCDEPPYNKMHQGIDISAPNCSDLYAMAGGVLTTGYEPSGLGLYAIITQNGTDYIYGHLQEVNLQAGQGVNPGDIIGKTGSSGNASGTPPHVHIAIYQNGSRVNPLPYFATQFDCNGNVTSPCN